ncbi:MAG: glycosyltransferase family 25 protein [Sphingomonas sp.]
MSASPRTKVFVVSRAGAAERRREFAAAAAGAALDWAFLDAFETLHPALSYDEDDAIVAKGRPLQRGEIGCYSSHYEAWMRLVADNDADQYIMLEDDVIADWRYLAALARIDHAALGHEYIRLYYKKPAPSRVIAKDYGARARWLMSVTGYCFGTQGYLVTKAAAAIFVDLFARVTRPIDDALDRSWIHGVANLAVFPFPLIERSLESGIGLARFEAHDVPARLKLRRAVARQRERLAYHLLGRGRAMLRL